MEIPSYSGYRPWAMRHGRGSSQGPKEKEAKRTRLSKSKGDRVLYTSAKGHRHNPDRYHELCVQADRINGNRRVVTNATI